MPDPFRRSVRQCSLRFLAHSLISRAGWDTPVRAQLRVTNRRCPSLAAPSPRAQPEARLSAQKPQEEEGLDTVDENLQPHDNGTGTLIPADRGLTSQWLLTNNPKKIHRLEGHGGQATEPVVLTSAGRVHESSSRTKVERMGRDRGADRPWPERRARMSPCGGVR
ncbi:hypothetical protein [Streptomyces sp. DG2A-72]|uniref:hypothetical protein n=1 Tax=Streptomyces sp. DG2A-72 TaxID=3051386 RepID=UPI0034647D37